MGLSIIIAYHNEGQLFIEETISQIHKTADIDDYEIILVDDFSNQPIQLDGVTVLRHTHNMGVGAAFDTGMKKAAYDDVIIMGCDIRFEANGWMSKMQRSIQANPKSIICTQLVTLDGIKKDGLNFDHRRKISIMAGARLLPYQNKSNDPKKTSGFKSILACQWLPFKKNETGIIVVPTVLGALYGIRRDWYNYIDGFAGHKIWGTLEPYISLKSWMFGGNCLCDKDVEVGHIFNRNPNHGIPQAAIYYNKMFVARVLFEGKVLSDLLNYLPKVRFVETGKTWFNEKYLAKKREEYKGKKVLSIPELEKAMGTSFSAPAVAFQTNTIGKKPKNNALPPVINAHQRRK